MIGYLSAKSNILRPPTRRVLSLRARKNECRRITWRLSLGISRTELRGRKEFRDRSSCERNASALL